jgi:hypothetical protein
MSQNVEDLMDEWTRIHDETMDPEAENVPEVDSSALTWDEETVRETHRQISLRSRRASGERLF